MEPRPPDPHFVAGRECGACNVCCVVLSINDPELKKVQGVRCHNARPDNRCGIYDTRPDTCRSFLCGWRLFRWVREPMRPDISNVLVRWQHRPVHEDGGTAPAVVVSLLSEAGLAAAGLAETVAAAVAGGAPVFLEVVGEPGRTYGISRIDGVVADVVQRRDKARLLALLTDFWRQGAAQQGRPVFLAGA